MLNPDRLFPPNPATRGFARALYNEIAPLPLICPHGHTEPSWFADNLPFPDPTQLIIVPDHYVLRMFISQGISLDQLGVPRADGSVLETDSRAVWRLFAKHYHLFRGTPSKLWLDYTFENLFGIDQPLNGDNADVIYDKIATCLTQDAYRPRALFDRFKIEVIATTDGATDDLSHHQAIAASDWGGSNLGGSKSSAKVIPTYRPDVLTDPDREGFFAQIDLLAEQTGEDTHSWAGYLNAHRKRRAFFKECGASATDHGHVTPMTADLSMHEAEALFAQVLSGGATAEERALFRAQMLTEMAGMSAEDGLVMQLHPGSHRNHSALIYDRFGRDKGFDIPLQAEFVQSLKPMLDKYGFEKNLSIILFTLDETTYTRELAPLAGAYPCFKLGPAWWFHDSVEGMLRYREMTTETAGFYNTCGFNDDTRALPSIPARHDVARRVDCAFLADKVSRHILTEDEALELAVDLTYNLPKKAYRLDQ